MDGRGGRQCRMALATEAITPRAHRGADNVVTAAARGGPMARRVLMAGSQTRENVAVFRDALCDVRYRRHSFRGP